MSKGEGGEDFGVAQTGRRADLLPIFFREQGEKGNKGRENPFPCRFGTYGPENKSPPEALSEPQAVCAGVKRINCLVMRRRDGILLKLAVQGVARAKG